jgi:glycosyltransferase involved in cell wall biosynthesis
MRVLHVVPSLAARTGGPAIFVAESCHAVAALGVETAVYTTTIRGPAASGRSGPAGNDLPAAAEGLDVRRFPVRRPVRFVRAPALRHALRAAVADFDVVHVHSLYLYTTLAAGRAAAAAGRPYVVTPHGALDPWIRRRGRVRKAVADLLWQRRLLRGAAALHVATIGEERAGGDVAPSLRRIVVPYGIHCSRFAGASDGERFRQEFMDGATGPIVANIGRISAKKRLDVLIRAVARARERADVRLAIVGPDDENLTGRLREVAATLGIGGAVAFTGPLYGPDMLRALAAARVWALPSAAENFAIAAVEAMAAGVPAVISDAMDIAPDVAAAQAGLVCKGAAEPLATAILRLIEDEPLHARLAEAGRAFAQGYDWSVVAPQLVRMYQDIVEAA